jgi:sterol desaturase/sphingolipid hydroxylase (fatty acid hydroxylase superfamily)
MNLVKEKILILFSTPLYLIVMGVELLLSHAGKQAAYTIKDTAQNIYLMLANSVIDILFRSFYIGVILMFFYQHHLFKLQHSFWYWAVLIVLEDFVYYWLHRLDHFCRVFWAVHVTHHSSQKFNFSVGFRSSVFEPLYRFVFFIPIALLGFEPLDIAFIYSATQIWGILVHTEMVGKLGWLEYIFVTPSHHRVHHASNAKYLDKNMGMFLIIWDKLFGTFQAELDENKYQPLRYGLTSTPSKQTPITIIFHEWQVIVADIKRNDISLRQKLGYVFGKPGWSHDGSRHTSDQVRKTEAATEKII